MMLSANTQAILLLTAHFTKASSTSVRPLTNKEWGKFALWLRDKELRPESLLSENLTEYLSGWADTKITLERLEQLLNRGPAMALAIEKWLRSGLWVITRSDKEYPARLKKHLKNDSPPVLFGCGNRALLGSAAIAVIGSRNTSETDLKFSQDLGKKSASTGYSIVSGGARGIDEAAMLGALQAEGTAIGVMADSLLRAASSNKYRKYLMNNNLVLISPFYPEAGFNVGNAMQRNKYIYCLSDAAVAVHSGTKGGTWNGVIENLKKNWVPMWVKETNDPDAGNEQLASKGAKWLTANISEIDIASLTHRTNIEETDLFSLQKNKENTEDAQPPIDVSESSDETLGGAELTAVEKSVVTEDAVSIADNDAENNIQSDKDEEKLLSQLKEINFYQLFVIKLEMLCKKEPKTADELIEITELNKTQLNIWLKQAVEEGRLKKLTRPVRYQWNTTQQEELF